MSKEIKIALIGGISGALAGAVVALIAGYFQYSTEQSKQEFEKEKIANERGYLQRKEMRELLAEYNAVVDKIYTSTKTLELSDSAADLLKFKVAIERIKFMGNIKLTNALNYHAMALLDYFNNFSVDKDSMFHDEFVKQSGLWSIACRKYFESSQ